MQNLSAQLGWTDTRLCDPIAETRKLTIRKIGPALLETKKADSAEHTQKVVCRVGLLSN